MPPKAVTAEEYRTSTSGRCSAGVRGPTSSASGPIARTFGASTAPASAGVLRCAIPPAGTPAAWITPCSAPKCSRQRRSASLSWSGTPASAVSRSTSAPAASSSATSRRLRSARPPGSGSASRVSGVRPTSANRRTPSLSRCLARAIPSPRAPPVIRYTPSARQGISACPSGASPQVRCQRRPRRQPVSVSCAAIASPCSGSRSSSYASWPDARSLSPSPESSGSRSTPLQVRPVYSCRTARPSPCATAWYGASASPPRISEAPWLTVSSRTPCRAGSSSNAWTASSRLSKPCRTASRSSSSPAYPGFSAVVSRLHRCTTCTGPLACATVPNTSP